MFEKYYGDIHSGICRATDVTKLHNDFHKDVFGFFDLRRYNVSAKFIRKNGIGEVLISF